jgi:hypothetical protein
MFTFANAPVTFAGLLILLTPATIWSAYELYRSRTSRQVLCNVAHLTMAFVMLVLVAAVVWQWFTKFVSIKVLIGIFLVAAAWFCWLAVDAIRNDFGHHSPAAQFFGDAAMMGAMAWHLSAMAVGAPHGAHLGHHHAHMSSRAGGELWIFAVIGLPLMAYLLVSAALNLAKGACPSLVRPAGLDPADSRAHRPSAFARFEMNFSMFWMSTGFLVPILPFMSRLAF